MRAVVSRNPGPSFHFLILFSVHTVGLEKPVTIEGWMPCPGPLASLRSLCSPIPSVVYGLRCFSQEMRGSEGGIVLFTFGLPERLHHTWYST